MSMKMVCNRCNKVKEDGESFDRIDYTVKSVNPYKDFTYDICPECAKLFSIFMDGGEVEEDHYKDSKPCAVAIHKLADGHYAIENVPKGEEDTKHSCVDCAYSYYHNHMLCCGGNSGGDFVSGDMICSQWESKEDDKEEHAKFDDWLIDKRDEEAVNAMNKEESDLCVKSHKVTCPTTGETITVPDSEPWVTSKKHISLPNACCTCTYEFRAPDVEPCKSCKTHSNWKPRETTNEQSSET